MSLSHVLLFATPWIVAFQTPLSMRFPRQEYWSRLPFSPPGDLPDPGMEPRSPTLGAWSLSLWTIREFSSLFKLVFAIPWTIACQAPLSMEFSRQEYWSGLPFSPPGDLPDPGIKPRSLALQLDALPSELLGKPWSLPNCHQPGSWLLTHLLQCHLLLLL